MTRQWPAVLFVLFSIAVALRLPALFQDLPPYVFCDEAIFHDEVTRLLSTGSWQALEFRSGGLNIYPVLVTAKLATWLSTAPLSSETVLWIGRILHAVILNAASIFFIFLATREMFGRPNIAIYAAFAYAISPMVLSVSRLWYPDHFIAFFSSGALLYMTRTLSHPRRKKLLLKLGCFCGCAISVKYTGILLAVPVLVLLLFQFEMDAAERGWKRAACQLLAQGALIGISAIVTFALLNFSLFAEPQKFASDFAYNINNYKRTGPWPHQWLVHVFYYVMAEFEDVRFQVHLKI